jgi:hypothetical protein
METAHALAFFARFTDASTTFFSTDRSTSDSRLM